MKKNKILFLITATSIIGVAAFLFYGLYRYSNEWHEANYNRCKEINFSMINILPILHQMDKCKRLGWTKKYHIIANRNVESDSPPINIMIFKNDKIINKVILFIDGGPGSAILGEPRGFDHFWKIAEQCNAVIIAPSYAGTYERSNYPQSSHESAEHEIGKLISDLSKFGKIKISILANSLAGNIISSFEVPIPAGNHILFVPMLRSPKDALNYFTSDLASAQEKRIAITRSQQYYVKKGLRSELKRIPTMDFMKAYFGKDQSYLNETFMDRWAKKTNVHPSAKLHAVIARNDYKVGGASYAPSLKKLGFSVEVVDGKHETTDDNADRYDAAYERFKSQVCRN